jgi:hypothetical protein
MAEADSGFRGSNSVVESQPSKLLVAGSIPVSRSSLRSLRELRLGRPRSLRELRLGRPRSLRELRLGKLRPLPEVRLGTSSKARRAVVAKRPRLAAP